MGFLDMIASLDKGITTLLSEQHAGSEKSPDTVKNTVDNTEKNVVSTVEKNVVDVTSKNFVSNEAGNVIQSPFVTSQLALKPLTMLDKGEGAGGDLQVRIENMFKF